MVLFWALLYGQTFFVLAVSIFFLVRRSVRLAIAHDLPLLAAFGVCEALVAWFPIWAGDTPTIEALWARLLLLGSGYAFLLAFAIQTLAPRRWLKKRLPSWWAILLTGGVLSLWGGSLLVARWVTGTYDGLWGDWEMIARYGLAFPGGLLGAVGLRRRTHRSVGRERVPLVRRYLRVAYLALVGVALLDGLIGPIGLPALATRVAVFRIGAFFSTPIAILRALCGAALTYGLMRVVGVVLDEMELWLESVERMQALSRERERIGRELHDGIIQSIYAAGLILEGARHNIPADPVVARSQLTRAIDSLNQTIQDIRSYIFDLRGELQDHDLEVGLRRILKDFRVNTLLETDFVVSGEPVHLLGLERRQHIFQITREALTNVARHARAKRVAVHLSYNHDGLELRIEDDGIGLPALPINSNGQGLRNMRERTRLLDGKLDLYTAPNEGMTITLNVPY